MQGVMIIFLCLVLFVLVMVFSSEKRDDHEPMVIRTYRLRRGETMMLELPGNPTTGYQWRIIRKEGDSVEIDLPLTYTIPPQPMTGIVGSGGFYTTRITARHHGRTRLFMSYDPPGSPSSTDAQALLIDFHVE